ncbi:uncharacterized protein N7458_004336 [Penicillium daleae]|uniref:Uncharacterized protein n=1 Tax=Penicillium daleae TaxID=63821 RepID=A0AAD6CAA9_9EURO|nr:uncharacterized protein N7458_004336 [Penicillium daleae]KAJ5456072.1 hypothetical protein N7458_004336 [Penicillium daleae]
MANFENYPAYQPHMAFNMLDDHWELHDPFIYLTSNQNAFTEADCAGQTGLIGSALWQGIDIGNGDFEPGVCHEPYRDSLTTEVYGDACDSTLEKLSQPDGPTSPSTSTRTHTAEGTETVSEELVLSMKRFTTTINECGVLMQTLGNSIEDLNSRLDGMEGRLDSIEHRLEVVDQGMDSLNSRFKTINGYLLEVIKREQMAMRELGDLASRYHEKDMDP